MLRCSSSRSMNSLEHHRRRSSTALLFAAACFSRPNFRRVRTSARTLLCWSSKGNGAGAGAINEGKQAHVIADAGIQRIERPGFQRRTWVPAPERMMLARRECTYGAIGVIVGRFVPHVTVRTGKAPPSVASTDRMSQCMRERA